MPLKHILLKQAFVKRRFPGGAEAGFFLVLLIAAVPARSQDLPAGTQAPVSRLGPQPQAQIVEGVPADYRLGVGAQILVRVSNAPDLNEKTFRVDQRGFIDAPMIGRVQAAGMTVEELEKVFVDRLHVMLQEPDVAITVAEYQTQPVSVFGDVGSPGVQQILGRKTLIEVLAMAGGARPDAGPVVRITRKLENGPIPLPGAAVDATGMFSVAQVELKPLIAARTPEKDILILPFDVISVPRAELVYIAGDVVKSGSLSLTDRSTMSIVEALSATGGVTKTADTKKARILRIVPGSPVRAQLPVDISKIMNGKAGDIELLAGDILVVPPSNMKKATQRALETAIQVGTVILSAGVMSGAL
jgi:polysaccharide export outer membrane protein